MARLIVSRHPAVAEFVRAERPDFEGAEVLTGTVSAEDVRDRDVAGVLPLALIAECKRFFAVEFAGAPPRGAEYGIAEMVAAGAYLREYAVTPIAATAALAVVCTARSSNSPYADELIVRAPEGTRFPARGDWVNRGRSGRVETIDFVPGDGGPLAFVGGYIAEPEGVVVAHEFEGKHQSLSLAYARPGARFRERFGYKCRHERHMKILGPGVIREVPAEEIASDGGTPLSASLADKLREAGIV